MFTLTFEEYLDMKVFHGKDLSPSLVDELDSYIWEGGFPKALEYDNLRDKRTYVSSVIREIFEKDIRKRVKIRNYETFQKVQTHIINNFGATTSIRNIHEEFKKDGLGIRRETLARYIQILVDAKILYECRRFDLKSRRSVRGEQKYIWRISLSILRAMLTTGLTMVRCWRISCTNMLLPMAMS